MISLEEKIFLIKTCYSLNFNYLKIKELFNQQFKKVSPETIIITKLIRQFELTGNVSSKANISRTESPKLAVIENYFTTNKTSLRIASKILNISKSSIHNILRNKLKFKPYKTQTVQLLTLRAKAKRLHFANNFDLTTLKHIWFTDESYFYLNPPAGKNKFVWAKTKPDNNFVQRPSHSSKILIWMAVSYHGIFWRAIDGTMNGESYVNLLKHEFIPFLESKNLMDKCIFMQDGAPCHTSKVALTLINEHFQDRVISTKYPEKFNMGSEWPPYSPDLTPLDFCIWATLKHRILKHGPKTLPELQTALHLEVALCTQEFLMKAIDNVIPRIQKLKKFNGGHIEL